MVRIMIIFGALSFSSITWASWSQSCPWEKACEYKIGQGSLGRLMCMRTYREAQSEGLHGDQILEEICEGKTACIDAALKDFNATPTTFKNDHFSVTAVICDLSQEQGILSTQIYNPTVLNLMGKSFSVTKELSFYSSGHLKSFTPNRTEKTITLKRGPVSSPRDYTCVQDSYWKKWFAIEFFENGIVKSCTIPSKTKFETLYGEMVFASAGLYSDGTVRWAYIPTNLEYSIKFGSKTYKITADILFHPSGKIKMASYVNNSTLFGLCLDEKGIVTKNERIEKINWCQ